MLNRLIASGVRFTSQTELMFVKLANIVDGVVDGFEIDPAPLELPGRRLTDLHASEAPKLRRVEARFQREVKVEMRGMAAKRKMVGVLKRSMRAAGLPMEITTSVLNAGRAIWRKSTCATISSPRLGVRRCGGCGRLSKPLASTNGAPGPRKSRH